MGSTEGQERGTDEAQRPGAPDFAEVCQGMMPAAMKGGCGSQMREMMARCLAGFKAEREDAEETEQKDASS